MTYYRVLRTRIKVEGVPLHTLLWHGCCRSCHLSLIHRDEKMEEYEVSSVVRGFHVYQRSWSPSVEEQLECLREAGNNKNRYAVAVLMHGSVTFHRARNLNIGGFLFGDLVLNRQIAKLNVSPIFLRLRYTTYVFIYNAMYLYMSLCIYICRNAFIKLISLCIYKCRSTFYICHCVVIHAIPTCTCAWRDVTSIILSYVLGIIDCTCCTLIV